MLRYAALALLAPPFIFPDVFVFAYRGELVQPLPVLLGKNELNGLGHRLYPSCRVSGAMSLSARLSSCRASGESAGSHDAA